MRASIRKSLITGLVASTWPLIASAQAQDSSGPLHIGLASRFRYEDSDQKDLVNRAQFSSIRLRPLVRYDLPGGSSAVLEGQFAKTLGAPAYVPTGTGGGATTPVGAGNTLTETSANTAYAGDAFTARQAYLDLNLGHDIHALAGRQALAYGDEYIIGPADWGVYGRSFDALRLRWTHDKSFVDVFQAKVQEVTSANFNSGADKDLNGVYLSYNTSDTEDIFRTGELYYFSLNDGRNATAQGAGSAGATSFGIYGGRFISGLSKFQWKFEYARTFGEPSIYSSGTTANDMFDTDFSFQSEDGVRSKYAVEVFSAGENWRDLYPTTNWQLGRSDIVGRRNLTGLGLHYRAAFGDHWNADLDLFKYQRTSSGTTAFGTDSRTALGTPDSTSKDIGTEEDLVIRYLQDKNLTYSLGVAFVQSGSYLKDSTGDVTKSPHYGFVMVESKF